jgi:hypothetical protein
MKKLFYVLLTSLFITVIGCSKGSENKPPVVKPEGPPTTNPTFTAADATTAYTAFNRYYYNTAKKALLQHHTAGRFRRNMDTGYLLGYGHECL